MNTSIWIKLAVACAISGGMITSLKAQSTTEKEVEVIDKNGKSVGGTIVLEQGKDGAGFLGGGFLGGASGGIQVRSENGKITISDANGKEHVIESPGAQSVTVTQSSKAVVKDGQKHSESVGKAIIIGPNGERQEIIFSGEPTGESGAFVFSPDPSGKFMIGVSCSPIPESLASQLKLDFGLGLLVENVSDDSPASAAGLQKHDILMYADDTELKTTADLVTAVEQAGTDKKPVSLTLVRGGKEMTVEATPTERTASESAKIKGRFRVALPGQVPLLNDLNLMEGRQLDLHQAGPGIIVGADFPNAEFHKQMQAQMEEMRAEIERMKKMFDEQKEGK